MLPDQRLQDLINGKDVEHAVHGPDIVESWSIIDGVMVIYDLEDPPAWLVPVLAACDDDGNTTLTPTDALNALTVTARIELRPPGR